VKDYQAFAQRDLSEYEITRSPTCLSMGLPSGCGLADLTLANLGRAEDAITVWSELTRRAPKLGLPHYNLGNIAMKNGNVRVAIERFRHAIELEPDYIPAIVNLAICYQNISQLDEALRLYDTALEISPDDAQITYNKAYLLYERGKYAEASNLFSTVVKLNPREVSSYNYLGLCKQAMSQPEAALKCFDIALAIDPKYSYAHKNKHMLLRSLPRRRWAIRIIEKDRSPNRNEGGIFPQ
jgi:tetratricopeptide (TPR) repeat protein